MHQGAVELGQPGEVELLQRLGGSELRAAQPHVELLALVKLNFSTMPAAISRKALVAAVKIRWRIERDCQELKQEFGLDNFEGRNWRGFHHHATLCIAAYGFLIGERLTRSKDTKKTAPSARRLPYPKVTPGGPPVRPQRHVADSIPTLRWEIAIALPQILQTGHVRQSQSKTRPRA